MINLILAIFCSSAISLLMRVTEPRRKSSAAMFISNYAACAALGLLYLKGAEWNIRAQGTDFTLALGAFAGILFLVSFLLLQTNVTRNGVALASVFMKLGVLVPVLISILFFDEKPSFLQTMGILLAVAAVLLFNLDRKKMVTAGSFGLLLLLLLIGGLSDSMINIHHKTGSPELGDAFLVIIFFSAMLCSVILLLVRKEKPGRWDLLFGMILGVPNYYSSRFLLAALEDVPAVAAYPVFSVGTILLISVFGVLVFKERLTRQNWIGMGLAAAAVAFLQ